MSANGSAVRSGLHPKRRHSSPSAREPSWRTSGLGAKNPSPRRGKKTPRRPPHTRSRVTARRERTSRLEIDDLERGPTPWTPATARPCTPDPRSLHQRRSTHPPPRAPTQRPTARLPLAATTEARTPNRTLLCCLSLRVILSRPPTSQTRAVPVIFSACRAGAPGLPPGRVPSAKPRTLAFGACHSPRVPEAARSRRGCAFPPRQGVAGPLRLVESGTGNP